MSKDCWITALKVQGVGVSLALIGFIGLLICVDTEKAFVSDYATMALILAFFGPYCILGVAGVWHIEKWERSSQHAKVLTASRFVVAFLYIDAICLGAMVYFSGGVSGPVQSIFTPIFVTLPAGGAIFMAYVSMKHPKTNLGLVVVLTLFGYAYSLFDTPGVIEIREEKSDLYDGFVLAVLGGTVILTTWLGFKSKEF